MSVVSEFAQCASALTFYFDQHGVAMCNYHATAVWDIYSVTILDLSVQLQTEPLVPLM
jgi:hypothetical protein